MTLGTCDYCGTECDSRLIKVAGQSWPGGSCYACRGAHGEVDAMHESDRIDAARWRALRPLLWVAGRKGESWIESIRYLKAGDAALTVDEIVDKLVQIAQEKQ